MNQGFCRLARDAGIELIEQKSRFIARGRSVEDETEAIAFLSSIRSQYPDASHHVYAYSLCKGQFLQRFSDDGEPSGTAGMPVLNILQRNDLSQSIIVVVRYFGGTLLGTGGLTRTYGRAAALLVREAGIERLIPSNRYIVTLPYSDFEPATRLMPRLGAQVNGTRFEMDAEMTISVPQGHEEAFMRSIVELTRGSALVEPDGEGEIIIPAPCDVPDDP